MLESPKNSEYCMLCPRHCVLQESVSDTQCVPDIAYCRTPSEECLGLYVGECSRHCSMNLSPWCLLSLVPVRHTYQLPFTLLEFSSYYNNNSLLHKFPFKDHVRHTYQLPFTFPFPEFSSNYNNNGLLNKFPFPCPCQTHLPTTFHFALPRVLLIL